LEEKTLLIQELTHYWSGDNSYIYVITPKGDIKKISKPNLSKDNNEQKTQEISCIDFAYAIHEEVGNHCGGAKVNNKIVKLNTPIRNGDVVEIITRKNISPNPTWLSFAATNSARNKIRRALKNINREQNIIKGRESLYKEIQKKEHGVNKQEIDRFLKSEVMDDVLRLCNYSSLDTLLAAIGNKDISKESIANKILEEYRKTQIGKEGGTSVEDEIRNKNTFKSNLDGKFLIEKEKTAIETRYNLYIIDKDNFKQRIFDVHELVFMGQAQYFYLFVKDGDAVTKDQKIFSYFEIGNGCNNDSDQKDYST
jgi:(p)ppGpp synthase/HD superfamily hydrolase